MSGNTIKLVIFDCDGVLIDSEIISARILIRQLAAVGIDVDFPYVQRHFLGRSWGKVAAEIRESYGLTLDTDFEDKYREELLLAFESELRTVDGIEAVLENMGVAYCVATSSSPKRARQSLELSGLAPYFGDRLYTASQVQNGKPAPDLFLHAAREMGFAPDNCLVIEDSFPGIRAAHAAGMDTWWFTGGSHLRGVGTGPVEGVGEVTVFDKWSLFFEMAPDLKRTSDMTVARDG